MGLDGVFTVYFYICNVTCVFIIELEAKLETNENVQEELENKIEQTAAALDEVKTTMTNGK